MTGRTPMAARTAAIHESRTLDALRPVVRRVAWSPPLAAMLGALFNLVLVTRADAADAIGGVTLLMGAPRMVGQSMRPLQPVLSGSLIATRDTDAAGVLVKDVAVHIGTNSKVTIREDAEGLLLRVDEGFVVVYSDPTAKRSVRVETPFGRLTTLAEAGGSGWYSVRHDPEKAGVSPAASTFATIEGLAEAVGTAPVAGPHRLSAGQQWQIVQGRAPGAPGPGDARAGAEALRDVLHRNAAEILRSEFGDAGRLASASEAGPPGFLLSSVVSQPGQAAIDNNTVVALSGVTPLPPLFPPIISTAPPPAAEARFAAPATITAGDPFTAAAQFVSYDGPPRDPNFNQFLTAVDGRPAFQPNYIDRLDNAGFSYIQLAGSDARIAGNGGETFLVGAANSRAGWAFFTPDRALADSGFGGNARLSAVVTDGFRAIAEGQHLAGGGAIGGNGADPASAFALVAGGNVQLNPTLPVGYPLLDRAADTTGLTVGGQPVSDQIAALGAGLNPQDLSQPGPRLLFLSDSDADALGNRFNFDGQPLRPTQLTLPGERQVLTDDSGAASQGTPLAASNQNTVGIQFAARGDVIAVIHHTGLTNAGGAAPASTHFEVVRDGRSSTVQWRGGARVTGAAGQTLEFEDLNDDPALRNELFTVLCGEVNQLAPDDSHTVCGPAITQPAAGAPRVLVRQQGRLARVLGDAAHRDVPMRHRLAQPAGNLRVQSLRSAEGSLLRPQDSTLNRRHIGRASAR